KNYYDILKITSHATQNEIKTAYYKLSLQYHPDKNKSDYAKQKFQDISDAYEILGNHEQRKNYDRHISIHQQPVANVKEPQHREQVYTRPTKIYDFDAWTQAHYSRQFKIDRMRRDNIQRHKKTQALIHTRTEYSYFIEYILYFSFLMLMMISYNKDKDVP
ncbi:Chaperone protein dnaJ, partial [Harpegnathos saltator]